MNLSACTCLYAPDPGCPVDHLAVEEDRHYAIVNLTADKLRDVDWLSDACTQPLLKPEMWRLFLDGDDLGFCAQLRKELDEQAKVEAADEVDAEARRAA